MRISNSSGAARGTAAQARSFRFCSLVSEASGEDPIGSAWPTARYLLVEMALPWGFDLLQGTQVPAGLKELFDRLSAEGNSWGLIGFAPDDAYSVPGLVRVIDLRLPKAPFRRYVRSEYLLPAAHLVPALGLLAEVPNASALDVYRQPASDTRDLLVCTHGAVDACCARFGYPVYRQLRQIAATSAVPVRVWRCTHFGGHRFAATLLDMPEGRYWGRLQAHHLAPVIHRDVPVANLRGCYRGWAALPHPLQQVAEAEAFARGDWAWTEYAVTPGDPPPQDATSAAIRFAYTNAAGDERGEITVDVLPNGTLKTQHACGNTEPFEAPQHRAIVRGDAR